MLTSREVRESPAVVFVAMGEHATLEAVLVPHDVSEIGQDEVDAEHFRSGNMMPQSTRMARPSISNQAQLRPISPRPPRKTIRTGRLVLKGASGLSCACRARFKQPAGKAGRKTAPNFLRALGEALRLGAHWQAALPPRQT